VTKKEVSIYLMNQNYDLLRHFPQIAISISLQGVEERSSADCEAERCCCEMTSILDDCEGRKEVVQRLV
jgi:hypothetical protein